MKIQQAVTMILEKSGFSERNDLASNVSRRRFWHVHTLPTPLRCFVSGTFFSYGVAERPDLITLDVLYFNSPSNLVV
jgi:hypothetical protein